ncbi:MAG: hypothetical protein NTZ83_00500, partial [Candidatus Pacearchaeota archaeon]|nr:hypothetical protein [Candidatus Pacearchaeota archaeon]
TTISGSSSVYTTNTGKLYIGQRGNGGYTNGKLDEVMIWNRSLSPTEVLELYNSYQGCTPNCAGKQCGNNGCGGSCGTCPTGQICSGAGVCSTTCTNDCPSTTSRQCSMPALLMFVLEVHVHILQ